MVYQFLWWDLSMAWHFCSRNNRKTHGTNIALVTIIILKSAPILKQWQTIFLLSVMSMEGAIWLLCHSFCMRKSLRITSQISASIKLQELYQYGKGQSKMTKETSTLALTSLRYLKILRLNQQSLRMRSIHQIILIIRLKGWIPLAREVIEQVLKQAHTWAATIPTPNTLHHPVITAVATTPLISLLIQAGQSHKEVVSLIGSWILSGWLKHPRLSNQ